ncbi:MULTISPECIES: YqcC family protein [unclassified Erwinia]|uniref:YqcC family protein n=1 Tax=unclassified Erwinia TaxID=2622719 RepID=UPI000835BF2E|nr:YqcC family protein [Erwinia sp. ErVv1]
MSREQQVQDCLIAITQVLQDAGLWQSCAPTTTAFESQEPFCVDTMTPEQWLQWVFLPRMQALLDSQSPLPEKLAIAPYYEMALEGAVPARAKLLHALNELDSHFEHNA